MDSLGTAHSKMGIPTFVNGRVNRILKKVVRICIKNFNIVVNFETKEQRRLLLYEFKSFVQISNLSSLTKAPLYPLMHVLDLSGSPLAKDLQVKSTKFTKCMVDHGSFLPSSICKMHFVDTKTNYKAWWIFIHKNIKHGQQS